MVDIIFMQKLYFIGNARTSSIHASSYAYKTKDFPDFQCFLNTLSHNIYQVAISSGSNIKSHSQMDDYTSTVEKLVYEFSKNLSVTKKSTKNVYLDKLKERHYSHCLTVLVCGDYTTINKGVFKYQLRDCWGINHEVTIITVSGRNVFNFKIHNRDVYQRITRGRSYLVGAFLLALIAPHKLADAVCFSGIVGEDLILVDGDNFVGVVSKRAEAVCISGIVGDDSILLDGDNLVGAVSEDLQNEADQNAVPGTNAAIEAGILVVITNQVAEGNVESALEEHPAL